MSIANTATTTPRLHLDKRAQDLAAQGSSADADQLLSTADLARWLGTSTQFLELGRSKGYGPKFIRLAPRCIRYRRSDALAWLEERAASQ
jgi:hypothetical protein